MRYNSKPETTQALLDYDDALNMMKEIAGNIPVFQPHQLKALRSGRVGMQDPNLSNAPKIEIDSMSQLEERRSIVIGGARAGMNFALQGSLTGRLISPRADVLDFMNIENRVNSEASMRHNIDWMLENRLEENRDQSWLLDDAPNKRRILSDAEKRARKAKQKAVRAARRKSR